jgi:hypothetical protein
LTVELSPPLIFTRELGFFLFVNFKLSALARDSFILSMTSARNLASSVSTGRFFG